MLTDIRHALRQLIKSPGFAVVAIVTLALGIGANTAIFSVVNAVLLRPLPFLRPEKLVSLWELNPQKGQEHQQVSAADFADWEKQTRTIESVAAYSNWNYNLTGGEEARRLNSVLVSAKFFQTLGAQPEVGRTLLPADDVEGKDNVVVLSHAFWQSRFGASRAVVGQTALLNGKPHTIVGVMPAGFDFPDENVEIWRPLALAPAQMQERDGKWLKVIGRLQSGTSLEQARAELSTIARQLAQQYPASNEGWGVGLSPLRDELVGDVRPLLFILLGAVGFIVLIACANLANLLLARASTRQKEMALRAALGASRGRLLRQFLVESGVLVAIGGGLGLLLAVWSRDLLLALAPGNVPRLESTTIDGSVLAFTLALSLLTALVCGLVPGWLASRADLNQALKDDGSSGVKSSGQALRKLLVIGELALGLILLVGAGLTIKSFVNLQRTHPGFNPKNLLTMAITLPAGRYAETSAQTAFFQKAIARIKTLPGVEAVSAVQDIPFRGNAMSFPVEIQGQPAVPLAQRPKAAYRLVTEEHFRTLRIPLLQGRLFNDRDTASAPPVVIINRAMAQRVWPNENPIGRQVRFGEPKDPVYSVVGVVGEIKHLGLGAEEGPAIYQPFAQKRFDWLRWMTLVVRAKTNPANLNEAVRGKIRELDPDQPVYNVATMEQLLAQSVARPRFTTFVLGIFALLALNLALVGIYGVLAFSVAQRTREIGIRMAIGAQRGDILRLVMGQGLQLVVSGVALGLLGALALTRTMQSLLFGVSAIDPATFAATAVLLMAVALAACLVPARRATLVNPIQALRAE